MKTAVSIPDEIFEGAERLASRLKRSRSEVYSRALAEYVARHAPEQVTEDMDRVVADLGEAADGQLIHRAACRTLRRTEW